MSGTSLRQRGRPIKHPRPHDCPHIDRVEHERGVCYQCSSNINNQAKREKRGEEGDENSQEPAIGLELSSSQILMNPASSPPGLNPTPVSSPSSGESQLMNGTPKRKQYDGMEMTNGPTKKKRTNNLRKSLGQVADPSIVELNIGGKIFTTTANTLAREVSMLTIHTNLARDVEGRYFFDRDPTHFRYILNYLREGALVLPSSLQDRMELAQEARYYGIQGLVALLDQQPQNMQAVVKDSPGFLAVRPTPKGLFYSDIKWNSLGFMGIKDTWNLIAMKFEEGKDEVTFYSITLDRPHQPDMMLMYQEVVCVSKLMVDRTAKATITLPDPENSERSEMADVTFSWADTALGQCTALYIKIQRDINSFVVSRNLDFFRTAND